MKIKIKKKLLKESAMTYVYAGKSSTDIQKELTQKIVEFLKKIKKDKKNKKQITQSAIDYLYHVDIAVTKKINIFEQYRNVSSSLEDLRKQADEPMGDFAFDFYAGEKWSSKQENYKEATQRAKQLKELAKENNVDLDNPNELYILEDCLHLAQGWTKEFGRISQEDSSIDKQLPAIKKTGLLKWLGLEESSMVSGNTVQGHVSKENNLEEMYSSAAIMGSGSGRIPAERSPEGHKRYVRIRFKRQGLQNFKPNRYFKENKRKKH